MDVRVRHFLADDHHADSHRVPLEPLRLADLLRDGEQMSTELGVEIDPVVDLLARDDEHVAWPHGLDREERHGARVAPDEPARELARDDAAEDRGHRNLRRKPRSWLRVSLV